MSDPQSPVAAPPEPWRSKRRRTKSAALKEAEADAEHERGKRRHGPAATVEAPEVVKRPVRVASKDKQDEVEVAVAAEAEAPGMMQVGDAGRKAIGVDDMCTEEPDAEDTRLEELEEDDAALEGGARPEPWRSTRRRRKLAALKQAEADAEHGREAKRRRGAAGKAGGTRRRRAAQGKPEEEHVGMSVEVGVAARPTAIEAEDVCADEPDAEAMRLDEEEEEAEALEAEEQDMSGAGTLGARKRVARPRATERRAVDDGAASEDHFVGEPVPDEEARRRWPARYRAKGPDSNTKRSDFEEGISARCHYRAASVDGAHFHR